MKSPETKELFTALSKAQSEIQGASKNSENPFFHSSYADLSAIWEACRGPLTKNNLSVIQTTDVTDKGQVLITTLAHSSGQWIEGRYPIKSQKEDPQALGSALSYARRYALAAIVGVYSKDDDGESAVDRSQKNGNGKPEPRQPDAPYSSKSNSPLGEYVIPMGSWEGKQLKDIDPEQLARRVLYLKNQAKDQGKQLDGKAKEFADAVNLYFEDEGME